MVILYIGPSASQQSDASETPSPQALVIYYSASGDYIVYTCIATTCMHFRLCQVLVYYIISYHVISYHIISYCIIYENVATAPASACLSALDPMSLECLDGSPAGVVFYLHASTAAPPSLTLVACCIVARLNRIGSAEGAPPRLRRRSRCRRSRPRTSGGSLLRGPPGRLDVRNLFDLPPAFWDLGCPGLPWVDQVPIPSSASVAGPTTPPRLRPRFHFRCRCRGLSPLPLSRPRPQQR